MIYKLCDLNCRARWCSACLGPHTQDLLPVKISKDVPEILQALRYNQLLNVCSLLQHVVQGSKATSTCPCFLRLSSPMALLYALGACPRVLQYA